MSLLKDKLRDFAQHLGFSMMAVAPARPSQHLEAYLSWIKAGMHGTMSYMARSDRIERRQDLNVILPDARSLIIVGLDYAGLSTTREVPDLTRGRIASYAWGMDYHDVMLPRLEELAGRIESFSDKSIAYRAYVDTGAILERSHAVEAGMGFIGKNTMLIHPKRGSYFFLGEIITSLELPPDEPPEMPGCGTCTRCLSACPTDAFPAPYVLDARRCISYLTIEYKGWIDRELRPLIGNWIFGCDVCQEVCPWQRFSDPVSLDDYASGRDVVNPALSKVLRLNDESFLGMYQSTPVERIGRDRLVRNACIAAGNSRSNSLADDLVPLLRDRSSLVRGHTSWALGQLDVKSEQLQHALEQEADPDVRHELQLALSNFI